jgi:hypothetical protein
MSSTEIRGWDYLEERRKEEEWQMYLAGSKLARFLEAYERYMINLQGLPPELVTYLTPERKSDETGRNRILHAQRSESINGKRILRAITVRDRPH